MKLRGGMPSGTGDISFQVFSVSSRLRRQLSLLPVSVGAALLTIFSMGAAWFLPSALLGSHYAGATVKPFDPESLSIVGGNMVLAAFPVFLFWLWFPGESARFADGVGPAVRNNGVDSLEIRRGWDAPVSAVIASLVLTPFFFAISDDAVDQWFESMEWWGWSFFVALWVLVGTLLVMTLLRVLRLVRWFTKMLGRGVIIRPLHPDECGGLGIVGSTFGRLAVFAIVIGLALAFRAAVTMSWYNQDRSLEEIGAGFIINGSVSLLAYVGLLYVLLFLPTLMTQRAMRIERDSILSGLSTQFDAEFSRNNFAKDDRVAVLQRIRTEYDLVKEAFPVRPFTAPRWRGLQLLSAVPPLIGIVSTILKILKNSTGDAG